MTVSMTADTDLTLWIGAQSCCPHLEKNWLHKSADQSFVCLEKPLAFSRTHLTQSSSSYSAQLVAAGAVEILRRTAFVAWRLSAVNLGWLVVSLRRQLLSDEGIDGCVDMSVLDWSSWSLKFRSASKTPVVEAVRPSTCCLIIFLSLRPHCSS